MPPAPKGEMSLSEIRNLVRQHNKMSTISPAQTRPKLLAAITDAGYKVDHVGKRLVKRPKLAATTKTISVAKGGAVKPQKRTVRKAFAAASTGEKPVLVKTKSTTKGGARKGKPVGSRLAYDATKQEAMKKKKSPPIPANKKGRKIKPSRKELIQGTY